MPNAAIASFYQRVAPKIKWRQKSWERDLLRKGFKKELQGYLASRMVYTAQLFINEDNQNSVFLEIYSTSPKQRVYVDSLSGDPNIDQVDINRLLKASQMKISVNVPIATGNDAPEVPVQHIAHKPVYAYERLTRIHSKASPASILELFIWKRKMGYVTLFMMSNLETGAQGEPKPLANQNNKIVYPFAEAREVLHRYAERSKKTRDFVDSSSSVYIPEGATTSNWNFVLNTWKTGERPEQPTVQPIVAEPELDTQTDIEQEVQEQPLQRPNRPDLRHLMAQNEDFEGYFTETVPENAADLMGSGSVDASQISGMFGKTNDAIQLVNQYAPGMLTNISFIFNFAKAGAYGVYVPALDRAIKTKALKKKLEGNGYRVEDEDGVMVAYPKDEEKTPEVIQTF